MIDGHVYIDVKTSITTSGSHNGIIVQSGIHQGPDMMFWPCTLNGAPTSFTSQQLPVATTPAAIQWPHTQEDGTDGDTEAASGRHNVAGKRTLPRPPSPVYSFSGADDEPPDNFIDSGNIRLNVFEPEGIVTEPTSLGSELMPSSNVGYYSDAEGRGAASRTPDNLATIARRPLSTMRNPNYDSEQWPADNMAATSTNITPDVNIRTKPLPIPRRNSIIRTYSNITPNQESYKTIATDYRQYNGNSNDDGAPNYDYNQIKKEFSRSPPLGKMPRIMANPRKSYGSGENLPITAPGFSQHESSRQPAGPQHNFSWIQQQHYKSTPDLRVPPPAYSAVQSNRPDSALLEMDEPKKVPEQMFHLYQTKDAFGNLLAQCEMEIETDDQLMSRLSLNASEKLHNQNVSDNKNFAESLGLPLILDDSVTHPEDGSRRKIPITGPPKLSDFSGAHPQVQQDFIDMTYNADALRNACSSLYRRRSVTRIPVLKKIPPRRAPKSEDFGYSTPDSANKIKASRVVPDAEIGSEYLKDERNRFERAVEKYATFPTSKVSKVTPFIDQEESTVAEKNPVKMIPEKVGNLEKAVEHSKNSGNIPEKETKLEMPVDSNTLGTMPQTTGGNPIKSILLSSARKSSLRKKVRFPPEEPQVIAVDDPFLADDIPDLV